MINQRDFSKLVEDWVFKNEPRYALEIAKHIKDIPAVFKRSAMLYRGMILDNDLIESIKKGYPLTTRAPSSWSSDLNEARRFITDPKTMVARRDPTKTGVIFRKKLSENQIILNIDAFALLFGKDELGFDELTYQMAVKERETLAKAGLKLSRNDIYKEVHL